MSLRALPKDFAGAHWLTPWEKQAVITAMLDFGILKWSNERNLALKNGGKTDIYINLRQARDHPEALRFFANLFTHPLLRLGVDRVAEIPQAVTCFSGLISTSLNKPLVTIRDVAKTGRVSDADLIGEIRPGELIGLYDDVITDGMSKVSGYDLIRAKGAKPVLVIGVDRQQGWQESFKKLGIDLPVWAGMSLHDVRAFLVSNGLMERCSEERERKNRIIIALDGKSCNEILPLLEQLRSTGVILKVNDLLAGTGIDELLPLLTVYGRVMVDLKFHDIPNTVINVCRRLVRHKPWACTVHASGGLPMIQAAKYGLGQAPTKVLAVTLLTSIDKESSKTIYKRQPTQVVKELAEVAWNNGAGADGFVCSPEEVSMLRRLYPEALIVTPGVRSPGADRGDQVRVDTPANAIENGADYIVGGRQFFAAPDPAAEVHRIETEEIGTSG